MAAPRRMRKGSKKGTTSWAKPVARKRAANLDVVKQVIKISGSQSPVQGLAVSNYAYSFFSPTPGPAVGGVSLSLLGSPEYAMFRQMYDQVRVQSVNVKLVPRYNATEATAFTAAIDNATLTAGKQVYYSVIDRDGIAPSSITSLKKYASVRTHSMNKPMSRTYTVKYEGANGWFDCQNPALMDQIQQNLGLWGGITIYGESFLEDFAGLFNGIWADVEVTYNVLFRGKALLSIAVDVDTGNVTLSQTPTGTLEQVQILVSHDDIDHAGAVDLSGNPIGV